MLNWILIIELVLLAVLGVMGVIGMFIGKQDPDDPVYRFTTTFWREFLWPPKVMSIDSPRIVAPAAGAAADDGGGARRSSGARGAAAAAPAEDEEASDDDAFYGRVRKDAHGRNLKCELVLIVIPNGPSDSVMGRDGDGMKIQVTGEAGESQANKSLIEMVATALGIKPYQVTLTKGHYQTRKTVQIQGLSPEELQAKLGNLAEAD